ncbi:M48 family metalloprotease [Myxococcota bacterium]|nr:M48 family metalloprotease [Myxococcota bacterium]
MTRRLVALSALLLAWPAASPAGAMDTGAPTFAITEADDYALGRRYVDLMQAFGKVVADSPEAERARVLAAEVVAASDRPDIVYGVYVLAEDDPNAMALPGGFLVLHSGILAMMSDDELRFVIGHEIAHVQLRHFATTRNIEQALAAVHAMGGAAPEGGRTPDGAALLHAGRIERSYSRQLEFEADLHGMLYALRSGGTLGAGVAAMGKLRDFAGETPPDGADEASHPSFADRIDQLAKGADNIRAHHAAFAEAVQLARSGACGEAVPAFERFLKVFPRSAAAWANLGACHLHLAVAGMPPKAPLDELFDDIAFYEEPDTRVRTLDPAHAREAERALRQALAVDPNRAHAWDALSVLYRRQGRLADARAAVDRALALDPKWAGHHATLGNLLAVEGDASAALKAWKKADSLSPAKLASLARNRALLFESRGQRKKAVAQWRQILLVPGHADDAARHLAALGAPVTEAPAPTAQGAAALASGLAELEGGDAEDVVSVGGTFGEPERSLGGLTLGDEAEAVLSRLPPPARSGDEGGVEFWSWVDRALAAAVLDGQVFSVEASSAAAGGTSRGLTVGADEARVQSLYGTPTSVARDPTMGFGILVYPSLGLAVFLEGGGGDAGGWRVSRIVIGPS